MQYCWTVRFYDRYGRSTITRTCQSTLTKSAKCVVLRVNSLQAECHLIVSHYCVQCVFDQMWPRTRRRPCVVTLVWYEESSCARNDVTPERHLAPALPGRVSPRHTAPTGRKSGEGRTRRTWSTRGGCRAAADDRGTTTTASTNTAVPTDAAATRYSSSWFERATRRKHGSRQCYHHSVGRKQQKTIKIRRTRTQRRPVSVCRVDKNDYLVLVVVRQVGIVFTDTDAHRVLVATALVPGFPPFSADIPDAVQRSAFTVYTVHGAQRYRSISVSRFSPHNRPPFDSRAPTPHGRAMEDDCKLLAGHPQAGRYYVLTRPQSTATRERHGRIALVLDYDALTAEPFPYDALCRSLPLPVHAVPCDIFACVSFDSSRFAFPVYSEGRRNAHRTAQEHGVRQRQGCRRRRRGQLGPEGFHQVSEFRSPIARRGSPGPPATVRQGRRRRRKGLSSNAPY